MIRWGLIGCGDVAEQKSGPGFQKATDSALVAVMRRDAARAADFAARHGVPRWYSDARALVHDPEVDAVSIATPPSSHLELALLACDAGKPTLVEKPMALSHGEGAREYYAEGRAAAEIARLWSAIERSVKAIRGTVSANGAMHKQAA